MRGAGGPVLERDFPPGSDILGDILGGPRLAKRMEVELFNRLAVQGEMVSSKEPEAGSRRQGWRFYLDRKCVAYIS
jgi:hypothetical protein